MVDHDKLCRFCTFTLRRRELRSSACFRQQIHVYIGQSIYTQQSHVQPQTHLWTGWVLRALRSHSFAAGFIGLEDLLLREDLTSRISEANEQAVVASVCQFLACSFHQGLWTSAKRATYTGLLNDSQPDRAASCKPDGKADVHKGSKHLRHMHKYLNQLLICPIPVWRCSHPMHWLGAPANVQHP